ncbi:hypothetical protein SMC26_25045 [Actinomadura fulvescens]|uniref:Uncharacterized protein n=1 Tax=Actinomadura fulvescens TaxID=46160 RepID=A0ABP6CH21_9ACTN
MTDLYNSPALRVEQPEDENGYVITDPEGGLLGRGTRVMGEQPKKSWLRRNFEGPQALARAVVRVEGPDGAPLFFADRAAESNDPTDFQGPPCAVVAPDGTLVGRFEFNLQVMASSLQEGRSGLPGGGGTYTDAHRIFDANGQLICDVVWEETTYGAVQTRFIYEDLERPMGGRFCTFYDRDRTALARLDSHTPTWSNKDRYDLQINYRLPEPLRTLILAAPIALDLLRSSE